MGSELDSFEDNKAFNYENYVAMEVETEKTCYSGGEYLNGRITLRPKEGLSNSFLENPCAKLTITENFHYSYAEQEFAEKGKPKKLVTKSCNESNTVVEMPIDFTNFQNANIMETVVIPFQVLIPTTIYPSILIDSGTYVKHYLSIDFPTIIAKKTLIIVIKNIRYFSTYNKMIKEPAVCYKKIEKGVVVSGGSLKANLTLPRNYFFYDEVIPFSLDLDCSSLSLNIKGIKVIIERKFKKNFTHDHSKNRSVNTKEISEKKIPLEKGKKKYHVEDTMELTEKNPKILYDSLDADKRKYSEKFADVHIYPSCYGGLISCEYCFKVVIQMNSIFYEDEPISIPIDFHCPFVTQQPQYPSQCPPQYQPQSPPQYQPQSPPQYIPQCSPQYPPQYSAQQQPIPNQLPPTMPQQLPPSIIPPAF